MTHWFAASDFLLPRLTVVIIISTFERRHGWLTTDAEPGSSSSREEPATATERPPQDVAPSSAHPFAHVAFAGTSQHTNNIAQLQGISDALPLPQSEGDRSTMLAVRAQDAAIVCVPWNRAVPDQSPSGLDKITALVAR